MPAGRDCAPTLPNVTGTPTYPGSIIVRDAEIKKSNASPKLANASFLKFTGKAAFLDLAVRSTIPTITNTTIKNEADMLFSSVI
jgi:hypothetical protein